MVATLHEQLASIAFAPPPPIPLFKTDVVQWLTIPADGRAFKALMVGGRPHTHRELLQPLEAHGFALIAPHWHADRERMPIDVPKGTEVMLIITTVIGHKLSNHARDLAIKAGIPYIGISTKATAWPGVFKRFGVSTPPAFKSAAPVLAVVPDDATPERTDADIARDTADPFYKVIVAVRKESGLSQRALAEKVGARYPSVSNWECGHSTPRYATYKLLLDVLPGLRNFPPPIPLMARVAELLTPTPAQIAEVAPTPSPPPLLSPIAELGVRYAEAVQEAEAHKRSADDKMRAAEAAMDESKAASERADVLKVQIFELATKG